MQLILININKEHIELIILSTGICASLEAAVVEILTSVYDYVVKSDHTRYFSGFLAAA